MTDTTFKEILLAPEKYYETPAAVSADARWAADQKQEILQAWKSNEVALQRAANEGLDGGNPSHLRQVVKELEKIDAMK